MNCKTQEIIELLFKENPLKDNSFIQIEESNEYEIIYDSDLNGFDKQLLHEILMNKSDIIFLIQTDSNELFGFHFFQTITKYERYIYDKDMYFFHLIHNNQYQPNIYYPNEMNPLTGIILSQHSSELISFGMNDFESDINYCVLYAPVQSNQFNNQLNSFNQFQFRKRKQITQQSKFHLFDDFFQIDSNTFDPELHFILERLMIVHFN